VATGTAPAVRHGSGPAARRFAEQNAFQRMAEGGVRDTVAMVMPGSDRRVGTAYLLGGEKRGTSRAPGASAETVSIGDLVTADPTTARMVGFVEKAAASDLNLLILGETGTGKELIARYVHGRSRRAAGPYIAVNCGAVSRELMASSFFGYVAGAFTGADPKGRKGFFETAHGGTLFLDEVGELPLEIQAALLRVLEDGSYQRVGSDRTSITDCRVIAATNRDLQADITRAAFRSDLYYRLNVVPVSVPPLRERAVDTRLLARRFVEQACARQSLPPLRITSAAEERLLAYPWPGNVRELRNVVEAAVICAREEITLEDLPPIVRQRRPEPSVEEADAPRDGPTATVAEKLREYERRVIRGAGQVPPRTRREGAGMSRPTCTEVRGARSITTGTGSSTDPAIARGRPARPRCGAPNADRHRRRRRRCSRPRLRSRPRDALSRRRFRQ
jgi:transcriptional regulator with PAS, ATPase and Fis domain